jgi:hypothetical protein
MHVTSAIASLLPHITAEIIPTYRYQDLSESKLHYPKIQFKSLPLSFYHFRFIILSHRWNSQPRHNCDEESTPWESSRFANTHKIPTLARHSNAPIFSHGRISVILILCDGSPITFHRCHLLWAIVRARKREQERLDL